MITLEELRKDSENEIKLVINLKDMDDGVAIDLACNPDIGVAGVVAIMAHVLKEILESSEGDSFDSKELMVELSPEISESLEEIAEQIMSELFPEKEQPDTETKLDINEEINKLFADMEKSNKKNAVKKPCEKKAEEKPLTNAEVEEALKVLSKFVQGLQ